MKSFVLAVLSAFLGLQFAVHAQVTVSSPITPVDSLQKLVNAHPKEDTTKVNLLNALARFCFYDLQYKRGIINAQMARRLAQKITYDKGEGLYLRALTIINSNTPLWYYFEIQTRWFYERIHEKETFNPLEAPRRSALDLKKANAELSIALTYAQTQQDKELEAMLLQLMGGLNYALGKYDASLNYADQAIQLFQKIGQPNPAFYVLTTKMSVLDQIKRVKEANVVETQVINIIAQTKDIRDKAMLCERAGLAFNYANQNKFGLALEYYFKANILLEQVGDTQLRIEVLNNIAYAFNSLMMYKKAVDYYKKALPLLDKNKPLITTVILKNFIFLTIKLKQFNEANHYIKQLNEIQKKWGIKDDFFYHETKGEMLMYQGRPQEAIPHFRLANEVWQQTRNTQDEHPFANLYIGQCYLALGNLKESIVYGEKAYAGSATFNRQELPLKASLLLTEAYDRSGQPLKAYEYLKKHRELAKANEEQDIVGRSSMAEIESIIQKSEQEKAALEREKLIKEAENQNQRWWLISAAGVLVSVFVLMLVLYRNNRQKQRANALLHRQKEEIDYQRTKAENALTDLKATQTQLIQKEKLASLGELTAGIAHEIQNPLNFVNNFSELSGELLTEMEEEMEKGDLEEAKLISGDLKQNLEKITHHGKRASSIVKGMLEHSRTGTGERQLTDLNKLADEYLRLSYHGMRAKNNGFQTDFKIITNSGLSLVETVPQEMGRVLLNLFNNAFYAVGERVKRELESYRPMVKVVISHSSDMVTIRVEDNGSGIPAGIQSKIFQPFFTTKPTGEGTGLGLSLSYDIVTKGHKGVLEVESVEGKGTFFTIKLPISDKTI